MFIQKTLWNLSDNSEFRSILMCPSSNSPFPALQGSWKPKAWAHNAVWQPRARGTFRSPFQRIFIIVNSLVISWKTLLAKLLCFFCFFFFYKQTQSLLSVHIACVICQKLSERNVEHFSCLTWLKKVGANNKVTKKFIRTSWKMTCSQKALKSSNIFLRIWKATYKGKAVSMSKLGIFRKAWKDPKLSPLANH